MTAESVRPSFRLGDKGVPAGRKIIADHQTLAERYFIITNGKTFQPLIHIFQKEVYRIVVIAFVIFIPERFSRIFFRDQTELDAFNEGI